MQSIALMALAELGLTMSPAYALSWSTSGVDGARAHHGAS